MRGIKRFLFTLTRYCFFFRTTAKPLIASITRTRAFLLDETFHWRIKESVLSRDYSIRRRAVNYAIT